MKKLLLGIMAVVITVMITPAYAHPVQSCEINGDMQKQIDALQSKSDTHQKDIEKIWSDQGDAYSRVINLESSLETQIDSVVYDTSVLQDKIVEHRGFIDRLWADVGILSQNSKIVLDYLGIPYS